MQKDLITLCKSHYCLEMLETFEPHPNELGEIIGYRNCYSTIFYTVRFEDYSTIDVPTNTVELLKICKSLPFQPFMENPD